MAWKHGLHYLREDHYHGMCVSCGAPAPCHIEPGWPDCADLCDDCKKGSDGQKIVDDDLYPEDDTLAVVANAHGMGQECVLKDVSEYLNLVAQELAVNTDMPEAATIVMGLAVTLENGTWHDHVTELRKTFTAVKGSEPETEPSKGN
jgi:hypothetical protein